MQCEVLGSECNTLDEKMGLDKHVSMVSIVSVLSDLRRYWVVLGAWRVFLFSRVYFGLKCLRVSMILGGFGW